MTEPSKDKPKRINRHRSDIKRICFYSFNSTDALGQLRMYAPASHLGLEVVHGVENQHIFVDRAELGDIIVIQRDFPYAFEEYSQIVAIAHQKHIPLVLDIDDLLFELPEYHPDRISHAYAGNLLPTFQAMLEADLVTVTTSELADYVRGYNKNVVILPNFLDDHIWQLKPPRHKTNHGEKIVIGYMGGHTHSPDLALLTSVIKVLAKQYPERLDFQFWGTEPPQELSSHPDVHWNKQVIWNYQDFAVFFQAQPVDILFAPLVNNPFNNCKSPIKYLEYASLGAPGVYSKVNPYTAVIKHGDNGLLADSAEEWLDCLTRLINKPEIRLSIASKATEDLKSNWLLSKNAPGWLSAYQKVQKSIKNKSAVDYPYLRMIHNLSHQITAWDRETRLQLDEQSKKIVELKDLVAQRDATLDGIHNSRTWKLALTFRRVSELIVPRKR